MRTVLLVLTLLLSVAPSLAQAQTACRDNFFNIIQRQEGTPASDWKAVLENAHYVKGVPKNPVPGDRGINAPFNGLTIMIDAGGNARGRVWYYTSFSTIVDGNEWFTHEYQVIADGPTPGSFVWAWIDKAGGAPRCPGAEPPDPPDPGPVDPPKPDLGHVEILQRLESMQNQLDNINRALELALLELRKPPPCYSGNIFGIGRITICPK
jgi:hypothetical protein